MYEENCEGDEALKAGLVTSNGWLVKSTPQAIFRYKEVQQ